MNDPFDFLDDALPPIDARTMIPDYILDDLPDGATEIAAARAFAYHMIWKIKQPKRLETVRKHFTFNWPFMRRLSEIEPEVFDELLCAYAERAMQFDTPNLAQANSVVSADQTQKNA